MNKLILSLALVSMLAYGCNRDRSTPEAKRARLEELKKEQSRIAADIAALEAQVGALPGGADTTANAKALPIAAAPVAAETFHHYLEVQGTVKSDNVINVTAKTMGSIEAVRVNEGDRVAKGQILATLDNSVTRASEQELRTQLEVASTLYNKQKSLWDQKIGSEVQYINAKAQKEGLERRLATLKEQLAMSTVVAPMSGTIDMVNAREGEAAAPGAPLFRLVNLSDLKVVANVAESYMPFLKVGSKVNVTIADMKKTLQGTVSYISNVVDPSSRTIAVEIRVPNNEGILKPNMFTRVEINDQNISNTIIIDQNLIQTSEQGEIVYVAEGKIARARKVKVGLTYNGKAQIVSGLKPGDQLVTQGYQDLTDGQPITM